MRDYFALCVVEFPRASNVCLASVSGLRFLLLLLFILDLGFSFLLEVDDIGSHEEDS